MEAILELVPNRVFFQVRPDNPSSGIHMNERDGYIYHYHNMDNLYQSIKIRKYFGPMTLSSISRHCALVDTSLKHTAGRHLFYTNNFETLSYKQKRTNAIFLMGSYLILRQSFTPEQTKDALHEVTKSVTPFTDMEGSTAHALTLIDCWQALYHGIVVNQWFRNREYSVDIDLGDGSDDVINWIVPGRLLALEDPKEPRYMGRGPRVRHSIVEVFQLEKVETVVRLNGRDYEYRSSYGQPYDSEEFVCRAIKHYDIFFKDGGIPSESQLNTFLKIVKKAQQPVAVHCHAGRGRTGTMLACSLVRFWGFEAVHAIAWVRLCRAACIVGIQQGFVRMIESSLRIKTSSTGNRIQSAHASPANSVRQIHLIVPSGVRKLTNVSRALPGPAKLTTSDKSKPSKGTSGGRLEKITVLPLGFAGNGAQRRKLRTNFNAKMRKPKPKVLQELTSKVNSDLKPQGTGGSSDIRTKTPVEQSNIKNMTKVNAQLKLSSILDVNLLKKMHMFQEQESKSKYHRANISDKISCYVTKTGNEDSYYQPKKRTVDKAKIARLETMLQFQSKSARCEQYDLKQKASKVQNDLAKIHSTQIQGSKSSVPFVKASIKYSSYQPTFDHLAKLLNFDRSSQSSVSSCGKEYKIPIVSCENVNEKDLEKTVSRHVTERRLAWNDPQVSALHDVKSGGVKGLCTDKKHVNVISNDFLEKHRQTLLLSKTANCAGGSRDNWKIKNLYR